ncbi:hypothetical protein [Candidatus Villigracilis affinis]|uniref:hypothetical protein n=1 Tax=Candidatus Villigracilis affinis TaxID=3140682 RepID=UPI001E0B6E78|nr:hypothetical protein [Anaerolineales bacterium]
MKISATPGPQPEFARNSFAHMADATEARARAERPDTTDDDLRALVRNVIDTDAKIWSVG